MQSHIITPAFAVILGLMLSCSGVLAAGQMEEISPEALHAQIAEGKAPLVLDVRSPEEYAAGHVPGAVNIPHTEISARLDDLRPHRGEQIVLYCKSGRRAGIAADILTQAGFTRLYHLAGDMPGWITRGLPVEQAAVELLTP